MDRELTHEEWFAKYAVETLQDRYHEELALKAWLQKNEEIPEV